MRRAWARLGLRGRLALSIAAIVVAAFAVVFVAVRAEMAHESNVIKREESREQSEPGAPAEPGEGSGSRRSRTLSRTPKRRSCWPAAQP